MRKIKYLIVIFCWMTGANVILASDQITPVKEALGRYICYEIYWGGWITKVEPVLRLEIKIKEKDFFVWIHDMQKTKEYLMAGFYRGRIKDGKGAIALSRNYNIRELSPRSSLYQEDRRYFETGTVIKDTVTIPLDCTPRYDPPTPQKEVMFRTVISTVQKQLGSWVKQGIVNYPQELTLTIADFNIDYPSTYVLVEQTKKLYSVTLHDPQNYDSDEYEQSGEYPFGEVYNKSKSLIAKVRKHGVIRKIFLNP